MNERTNAMLSTAEALAVVELDSYRRGWAPQSEATRDAELGAELQRLAERTRRGAFAATRETLIAWGVPPVYLRAPIDRGLVPSLLGAWADTWPTTLSQGGGCILEGPVGVGKTSAAVYLLDRLWASGQVAELESGRPTWQAPRGQFVAWDDIAAAGAMAHMIEEGEQSRALLRRAMSAGLLVVDDWASTDRGDKATSRVEAVVWKRWERGRPTVITANTRGAQFSQRWPRTFSRVNDQHAAAAPGVLRIGGGDRRRGG